MSTYFVIPARKGSKGVPHKNRQLVPLVIKSIRPEDHSSTILTSDDEEILNYGARFDVKVRHRPDELSNDIATMKEVLLDVIKVFELKNADILIVLYPTYPERKASDIDDSLAFFKTHKLSSMLCKKDVKTHPYLCLLADGDIGAKSLIEHSLYRRQDYPECFEICHFVCIAKVSEVGSLNSQLFNGKTGFYKIEHKIDVDYQTDYVKFKQLEG